MSGARRLPPGQAQGRGAPAAHFAAFAPQADGCQLPVEFFLRELELAAHLALDAAHRAEFALGSLQPGELGPHFVGQRSGGSDIDGAGMAVGVAHHEQIVRADFFSGPAAPSRHERSAAGEPPPMLGDELADGLAALVNRMAKFHVFPAGPEFQEAWASSAGRK